MDMDRRKLSLAVVLLGTAALARVILRKQRETEAANHFRGKVALITGGSRGLGFAIAQELASSGCRLVLTSRHIDQLQRAKDRLPGDVLIVPCDVSHPEEIREVVATATSHFGHIDIVVNNAGIIMVGPVEGQTLASFQEAMNINFFGSLHTTLAVLPQMLARGSGAIVNIASIGGKVAFPHLLPYVASKFAVVGWSQGLRAELAGKGIQVTTVTPGIMRTGSHIQARYTGDTEKEYRWFAGAASFPGTSSNATAAAKNIVRALLRGSAEVSIGLQAIAAARLANLSPELTAILLQTANIVLPNAPQAARSFWDADRSLKGAIHRGSLPALLERSGTAAIEQYNQSGEGPYLPTT
jgi:short-subunit dehydrogenase